MCILLLALLGPLCSSLIYSPPAALFDAFISQSFRNDADARINEFRVNFEPMPFTRITQKIDSVVAGQQYFI